MRAINRFAFIAAVSAGLMLSLPGCQDGIAKSAEHDKEVTRSNEHWLKMRSNLMLGMARQQFDTGDLDQADKTLSEALGQDPKNAKAMVLMGRVSLERSQLERASLRFTEALAIDAKLADAHYYLGIVLQRWQRYPDALDHYKQAFELERDNVAYLLAISDMLVATDKVDEAVALLTDKATYFDQNAAVRVGLGQLYMLKRDYPQAIKYYQEALLLKPDDKQVKEALMHAQLRGGKLDAAVLSLEELCHDKAGATRRDLQRLLGETYMKMSRPGDAREVFLKLTQSEPTDVQAWVKLGEAAWALDDTGGALLAANRAMSLAPQSQEGFLLAGLVWQKRGRLDEALRLFDRAAELAPRSDDALVLRGLALAQAGRTTAAAEAYSEALRREPNDDRVKGLLTSVGTEQSSGRP